MNYCDKNSKKMKKGEIAFLSNLFDLYSRKNLRPCKRNPNSPCETYIFSCISWKVGREGCLSFLKNEAFSLPLGLKSSV